LILFCPEIRENIRMKKLILVAGPAGIGKSSYCESYRQAHQKENVHIISSDETRKKLTSSYRSFPKDKNGARDMSPVYEMMVEEAKALAERNANVTVLLDTTMLEDERRLYFINHLNLFEEKELKLMKLHDYSACLVRNKKRDPEKWVPDEVILDMIKNYADPSEEVAKRFSSVEDVYLD
jgi:tRNA uridine 5-carbamoylmethylation protein Kti12